MTVWRTADPAARLTDPERAVAPRETTPADAQAAVNFVVFEPGWVPGDCSLVETTLRPELPPGRPEGTSGAEMAQSEYTDGNPCSLRWVLAGDGRRLRVKQFLYDWAPPAAGIPSLWRTADPTPFTCGDAVGWLGTDYEGRRGACLQADRTQVELSVLDGEFGDEELQRILGRLEPAAPEAAAPVRRVPFHRLSYWVRYRCRPPGPSHGLFDHGPVRPYDEAELCSPVGLRGELPVRPLVPGDPYVLDSAVVFPDVVECVYRHQTNASDHLWTCAAAPDSDLAPDLPPEAADQPAQRRGEIELRGETVHYAALTERWGAWEAFWEERGVHHAVWAGPSRWLSGEQFREVVDGLAVPGASNRQA